MNVPARRRIVGRNLAGWRSGDITAAKRWFDVIMTDGDTPPATRNRIEMLIALVAAESKG